ncbi:glycosyltransferase [Polaribacter sp. PL03]|uniref:glycosyltransferase n=1 Tax=Polaribacter sp. PL03 TaxID=3088353 RepID=UPI0029CD0EEF|nr:glycosyltransferase [Polaribacter sp. PL03]MDX6746056.1 glycosyltransferase [Polaribacter sp. PL03]
MNKLGVIQIIDTLETGGAEVLAVNIANGLTEEGLNSHICVTRKEGPLLQNIKRKSNYIFLNRTKTIDFRALINFKRYLKDNKVSIIHAHATSSFFAFCIKLMYPKIRIVWHNHYGNNINLSGFKLFILKMTTIFFHSIINVNEALSLWAIKKLYTKNVYYLENFAFFSNKEKITKLKGEEGKRIVHLASFRPEKDHENLIIAFSNFIKKNKDWTLHLVGRIDESEYSKKNMNLIKTLGLEKHIFVYGSCFDIHNILSQANIGVLSSKSEGLPIAMLEYGLANLPIIVTDVGECSSVVKNNVSGLIVKPKNHKEFSEALDILVNSEDKRRMFSKAFNTNVLNNYSKESFFKQLINIYKL